MTKTHVLLGHSIFTFRSEQQVGRDVCDWSLAWLDLKSKTINLRRWTLRKVDALSYTYWLGLVKQNTLTVQHIFVLDMSKYDNDLYICFV